MPGMNGLDTARAIRAREAAAGSDLAGKPARVPNQAVTPAGVQNQTVTRTGVPIIALTAHSDDATSAAARAAGMDDFITKPVDAPVLYEKLGRFIRQNAGQPQGGSDRPALKAVVVKAVVDQTNASMAVGTDDVALLDLQRLEGFRQIGMLEELVSDYLPEIASLVEQLESDVAGHDMALSLETLHSLLGMSGEAGASALYQLVRRVYVPMVEDQQWPVDTEWLVQLKLLSVATGEALRVHTAAQPRTNSI